MLVIFWIVPLNRTSMIARTLDLRSSLFCRASFLINLTDERLNVRGLHFSVSFFLGYRFVHFPNSILGNQLGFWEIEYALAGE